MAMIYLFTLKTISNRENQLELIFKEAIPSLSRLDWVQDTTSIKTVSLLCEGTCYKPAIAIPSFSSTAIVKRARTRACNISNVLILIISIGICIGCNSKPKMNYRQPNKIIPKHLYNTLDSLMQDTTVRTDLYIIGKDSVSVYKPNH